MKNNKKILIGTPEEKRRENECVNREFGCCKLVNESLGWSDLMPLTVCDKCFNAGIHTQAAQSVRDTYHKQVIENVTMTMGQGNHSDIVMSKMFSVHLSKQDATERLLSMCDVLGEKKSLYFAEIIDERPN